MRTPSSTPSRLWWKRPRTCPGRRGGGPLPLALAIVILLPRLASGQEVPLPPGKGVESVTGICSICHGLDLVTQQRQDRDGWTRIVDQMIQFGAPIPPGERQVIIDYLATHFSPAQTRSLPPAERKDNY